MDSPFPTRIGYEQALGLVHVVGIAHRLESERISIRRADGRVLAETITAPIALPPFDNSRMDGFAFRHADLAGRATLRLRLAGEQFAGVDLRMPLAYSECVRITTGAPMPADADTVVIKENTRESDGSIELTELPLRGANVGLKGEDVPMGQTILHAGEVLTPSRVSLVAAMGMADITVARRPTVAVFTTGDELVEPGMSLHDGQIYNSNRELLMGLLRQQGLEPTAWPTLPDDPERVRVMLSDAACAFDLVLTCGGVSAGEKDYLPAFLGAAGRIHFWKTRIKPGMPVLFGELDRALVLGLPGNPVSVLATFQAFAIALLDAMQGRAARPRWFARLAAPWNKRHERHEFLRGRLQPHEDGSLWVMPNPADGSHRLRGAADSDALILLPEGERAYAAGEVVGVVPY